MQWYFKGDHTKAKYYEERYVLQQRQIETVFWDETEGAWFDYHLKSGKRDHRFFVSMIAPMFVSCHGATLAERERKVERVLSYINVRALLIPM